MSKQFSWRENARVKGGLQAQAVGEELDRIKQSSGQLTPQRVVNESQPEGAVLHPCFTWDDAEAANEHRKHQANNLIWSVKVTYEDAGNSEPAYVHVKTQETESQYEAGRAVAQNFSMAESAWRAARARVEGASKALQELEELLINHGSEASLTKVRVVQNAQEHIKRASDLL